MEIDFGRDKKVPIATNGTLTNIAHHESHAKGVMLIEAGTCKSLLVCLANI